jgi:hypothetical protein
MKKIENRQELSQLYYLVQSKLEGYLTIHKISVTELHNYVSHNIEDFIKECDLDNVLGVSSIIYDVIEHLKNNEGDSIEKFESFRLKFM